MAQVDPEELTKLDNKLDEEDFEEIVDDVEEEEKWTSRWSFILAAIGSAIGLGNFWRFPYVAYNYGGGAFFIPYLIALFVVGIPLMQLEMALGQVFRRAAVQAFGKINERWAGVGIGAAMISFGIVSYYCAILGWGNVMLVKSFYKDIPWSIRGVTGPDAIDIPSKHFYGELLQLASSPEEPSVISAPVFFGSVFQWVSVFLILVKGQAFISKAVWLTVLLPVVMLIILVGVGLTLEGSGEGIRNYIGLWDMSVLSDGQMWVAAFGQIFFSLSLSTGVMTAYASLNPKNANIFVDGAIVACCNCFFSFIAGFAVFSIVGYLADQSGTTISELRDAKLLAGPSLAFVTYPAGLSLISGAGANILCIVFFVTFYFLGVDSAFSLVEAVVLNIRETKMFAKFTRTELTAMVCVAGLICTSFYTMDIGLYLLDVIDAYISSYGLIFIGFLEAFVTSWLYKRDSVTEKVGPLAPVLFEFFVILGFCTFAALSIGLPYADVEKGVAIGVAIGSGLSLIFIGFACAAFLGVTRAGSYPAAIYYCSIYNVDSLRKRLNKTIMEDAPGNTSFPLAWAVMLKFVVTPILGLLLCVQTEDLGVGRGYDREGYPKAWINVLGACFFLVIAALVFVGVAFPKLYADPKAIKEL